MMENTEVQARGGLTPRSQINDENWGVGSIGDSWWPVMPTMGVPGLTFQDILEKYLYSSKLRFDVLKILGGRGRERGASGGRPAGAGPLRHGTVLSNTAE